MPLKWLALLGDVANELRPGAEFGKLSRLAFPLPLAVA